MAIEEEHQDVLQNLEFAIINLYRQTPDLIDAEVLTAIEALIRTYSAEAQGKSVSNRPIRGLSQTVAEAVKQMCEFRLGRSHPVDAESDLGELPPPISVDILVACLKRIQSSIKFWSKREGRQGYLNYVQQFIK
ncbi:hypothetical protein ACN4EK_15075 [Pantanalinema rosaneae CENA516]|uniref:hypothetical protein n=1 Tax=Pantanalinema rosaneae TaxID=1620701 RepID=UPI003D6F0739